MKCLMIPFRYKEGRAHSFMLFVVSDTDDPLASKEYQTQEKYFELQRNFVLMHTTCEDVCVLFLTIMYI